jgi:2-hydroxychromene-2-carboxylate isomerase
MTEPETITVYIDFKSPYAYLAKQDAYALERDLGIRLRWLPYILDIPQYLGSATLGPDGQVIQESRNAHQWRRVRYSYMDCRRQARKQGLIIRGTQKIWDSSLAAAGMLFAQRHADLAFRRYMDAVFERFWRRELDIEQVSVIAAVLTEAGCDGAAFPDWAAEGRAQVSAIGRTAEDAGVFGVPTFVVGQEIFWGREHVPEIRALLLQRQAVSRSSNRAD